MSDGVSGPWERALEERGLPAENRMWALMAALPAVFLKPDEQNLIGARAALDAAAATGDVLLSAGEPPDTQSPDLEASLWFICAAHAYAAAGGDPDHVRDQLLPRGKRIIQGVISGNDDGHRMDDGGMLTGVPPADALRLNALWYAALETLARSLHAAGDPAGDHFERLAGRFRRSFAKAYWCDEHGSVCLPVGEGQVHASIPDADQVLLSVLPASPIPRTKQRQALLRLRDTAMGDVGLRLDRDGQTTESVIHRLWLARALAATADNESNGKSEAADVLAGLRGKVGAQASASYRNGAPLGPPDLLATAELRNAATA